MTKKINRKALVISLFALGIAILTIFFVTYFVIRQQSAYIGYDGYIWYGTKRSNKKADEKITDDEVLENTLDVAGDMTKYFDGGYVDLSNKYIALLQYYKKYSNTMLFSEIRIKSITVFAKKDGNLSISVAKVEDVVKSRTSNAQIEVKDTKTFQVTKGQTTIEFDQPLFIDKNETIVLGGNGSVPLYYVKDIPVKDEAGNFTVLDGQQHKKLLQSTGENKYNDTLAVEVKIVTTEEKPIFENLRQNIQNDIGPLSTMKNTGDEWWATYMYSDEKLFSGKTITKICLPLKSIEKDANGRTYLDVYLLDAFDKPTSPEAILDRNFKGKTDDEVNLYLQKHRLSTPLEIPAEKFDEIQKKLNASGGSWIDFDCHIEVGENQTLAFGGHGHGIYWLYLNNDSKENGGLGINLPSEYSKFRIVGRAGNTHQIEYYGGIEVFNYMLFDFYYEVKHTTNNQIEKLNEFEREDEKLGKLREALSGKQVSILGDSISTYEGYSNEYETQNSDIKSNGHDWVEDPNQHNFYGNRVAYPDNVSNDLLSADETWWLRTINQVNANLCVNNSFSGGLITDNLTIKRSSQLHDNTFGDDKNLGQEGEIYPEIVAIYMGTNDFNSSSNVNVETFYNIYRRIVLNIFKCYMSHSPNLKVFLFTLPPSIAGDSKWCKGEDLTGIDEYTYTQNIERFNNKIRQLAEEIDNVEVVDLFKYCNRTREEMKAYANDAIHPNVEGMKLISNCFIDALYKNYITH